MMIGISQICNSFRAKRTITMANISYKKKNAKQYKAYKLNGDDSPLSIHSLESGMSHDRSIDPQIYGHFSISPQQEKYMLAKCDSLLEQFRYDDEVTSARIERYLNNLPAVSNRSCQEIAKDLISKEKTSLAKSKAINIRRKAFSSDRAQLVLMMIDSGIEYVCNYQDCEEREFLTVDHIYPLSRGGGDKLENLQFLCKSHNSIKGDKVS